MNHGNVFVSKSFKRFSSYTIHARRWKLYFRKMDKGSFSGVVLILDTDSVQLTRTRLSGIMDHIGNIQPEFQTFIIPMKGYRMAIWQDTPVEGNTNIAFPYHGIFRAVSFTNFDVFDLSIHKKHIQEIAKQCQTQKYQNQNPNSRCLYSTENEYIRILRSMLYNVFDKIRINTELIHCSEYSFYVKYQISYSILSILNRISIVPVRALNRKRDQALSRTIEFISLNIYKAISVRGWSRKVNTTQ